MTSIAILVIFDRRVMIEIGGVLVYSLFSIRFVD
jgi:hypothetical protein